MKKRFLFLALLLISLTLLPTLAMAENTMWVVTPNGKSVNMRVGPSMDDAVLTRVPFSGIVDVIYDLLDSSYLHCEYKGYNGYIQSRYLADYEPEWPDPPSPNPTKKPTPPAPHEQGISYNKFKPALYLASVVPSNPSSFVNMRWAPNKSTKVQQIYYNAQTLLVIAENGTWSQVYDMENHKSGFMMSSFLRYYAPYDDGAIGLVGPEGDN
ncbi:MAG: SH3 domain-containing protein [Clostridia bacterium]